MKTIYGTIIAAAAIVCAACTDLTEVNERIDSLETRVEAIEAILPSLNANIEGLRQLAGGSTINKVDQPSVGVYELTLSNGTKITLDQGSIGVGKAPVMSVDADGFWMADYQDGAGAQYVMCGTSKVAALGQDGQTPRFGVDSDCCWTVSYDGGKTFSQVKGADGKPVKAIGEEGASDSYFSEVSVKDNVLTLVLKSGQTYTVPVVSDFLFAIKGADDIQLFNPGDTKSFEVEMKGVADAIFSKPEGWSVSLSDQMLKIKAPAATKATIADSEGEVSVLAISTTGYSAIAKVKIQIAGAVVDVNPTVSLSVSEKGVSDITFKVLSEDVTGWYYIFQKTSATAPDASKILSSGTQGSGTSIKFESLEEKTSYTLYVLPVNDTKQGTMASLPVTTDAEKVVLYADNLTAWNEGKSINIAGQKYNKAKYGEATVLKAETVDTELPTLAGGVYILEAEKGCNFKVSHDNNGFTIGSDVILIGRYAASRPEIKLVGFAKIGGWFAMRDLKIDYSVTTKNYKMTFMNVTEGFHIDSCTLIPYNEDQTGYCLNVPKSFRLVNSDIKYNKASGTTATGINFSNSTKLYDLKEILIENNIFYNPAPALYLIIGCNNNAKLASQVGTPGGVSITMSNNTFYNLTSSSASGCFVYTASADLLTIENNIFYTGSTGGVHRCVKLLAGMPTTMNFGVNIAYGMAYQSAWKYVFDTSDYVMTRVTVSPFETVNENSLTFIPVEEYAELGAKRN